MTSFPRAPHRAVVLQGSLQKLELGGQRVMALGHEDDAIEARRTTTVSREGAQTLGQLQETVRLTSGL